MKLPHLSLIILLVAFVTSGCNKTNQPENNQSYVAEPSASNELIGQGLNVNLKKINYEHNDFCNFYFEVTNNTGFNITGGMISVIQKDQSGSIVDKGYIHITNPIKPSANSLLEMYAKNCSLIASLNLNALEAVMIDGEFPTGRNEPDIPLHPQSEAEISVN